MTAPLHSHTRAADRGMSEEVRALSTRAIDPRAAAKGFVVVAALGALLLWWRAEALWIGADDPSDVSAELLRYPDPEPVSASSPAPSAAGVASIVVLLVDGLRVDEAQALPAMRAFQHGALSGVLEMPRPTLSTGAYHALFTGAPNRFTGVHTNRFHFSQADPRARVDSLADRVRAISGREEYVAEGLDWLVRLLARAPSAPHVLPDDAFDAHTRAALLRWRDERGPGLFVAHMLAVDESAHASGIRSRDHREALDRANTLIDALLSLSRARPDTVTMVLADHGHLDLGGHGGDEPEVRMAPFALRGPTVLAGDERPLPPECVASLLAQAASLPTPLHATCVLPEGLVTGQVSSLGSARFRERVAYAADALRKQRVMHELRTFLLSMVMVLLVLMGLGATKRSFSGLDAGVVVAPLVWAAGVLAFHLLGMRKPLTLSAIDLVTPHLLAVGFSGAGAGALGIALGARLSHAAGATWRLGLRRAAAGLIWATLAAFWLAWARVGGSYAPWPSTAFAAYAPVLLASAGIGGLISAGLTLLATVAKREDPYYARPQADGSAAVRSGDIT